MSSSSQPVAKGAGLSHIGQIAINVKDPARATAFYRDKLGDEVSVRRRNVVIL
jgi:catechol-2,3-dioxygenase